MAKPRLRMMDFTAGQVILSSARDIPAAGAARKPRSKNSESNSHEKNCRRSTAMVSELFRRKKNKTQPTWEQSCAFGWKGFTRH